MTTIKATTLRNNLASVIDEMKDSNDLAEKIEKLLPKDTLKIKFKTLSENEREVTIENE